MAELFVPVTEDLRLPDQQFDIVKGVEIASEKSHDKVIGSALKTAGVTAGQWVVLNDSNELEANGGAAVPNCYPVWVGNDSFDSQATGKATIIMGGGIMVQSKWYNAAPSYVVGMPLTVKTADGKLTEATGTEAILARVTAVPANGVIEYLVTNR